MIVDLHSDFPADLLYRRRRGETAPLHDVWLPRWRAAGVVLVVGAVFVENVFVNQAQAHALEMVRYVLGECTGSTDIALARTFGEIQAAMASGRVAVLLSLEGAEPLRNLSDLELFYSMGVRLLGLTWSRPGPAGHGNTFDAAAPQSQEGLTGFGRSLVRRCEELGVIVDVSHLNDAGFLDVDRLATKPYIASHSNSRAVWGSPRNLTDAQAARIAERGGLIGLNAVNIISGPDGLTPHAGHWRSLFGTEAAACGFDFGEYVQYYEELRPGEEPSFDIIPGYPGIAAWGEELRALGWGTDEIDRLLGGNAMRFFERWLT